MTISRIILETGMGNDLYGEDYTKAACRAVEDAIHYSSLILFRSLNLKSESMKVKVTIGIAKPEMVDLELVKSKLPHGEVSIKAIKGGLNIDDNELSTVTVIATAAVEAFLEIQTGKFKISRQ